jgi:Ubiquitin interaction motif
MASSDPHDNNNQRDNNFGKGYALGSAATSSNNNNNNNNNIENVASSQSSSSPLTKEQLREQRLKRLSNSGTAVTPKLAPPSLNVASLIKDPPPAKSLSDPHEPLPAFSFHNNDDDYAEDSDLQAAIALSMGKTSSVDETPPSTTSLLTSQASNYSNNNNITYQDQEDAELQAALALSLGIVNHPQSASNVSFYTPNAASTATTPMDIDGDDHGQDDDRKMPAKPELPPPPSVPNPLHFSGRVRKWYTRPNPTPMADIHHILWDTTITTLQDQQRWVSQGIQFKQQQQQQQVPDNETTTASRENLESSSLVATVVANHQGTKRTKTGDGSVSAKKLLEVRTEYGRVVFPSINPVPRCCCSK